MAAHLRGDAAESQRLSDSAPKQTFQVADHYPLAKALGEAVHLHLLCLLNLAGSFWQWWGLWLASAQPQAVDEDPKTPRRRTVATSAKTCRQAAASGVDASRAYGMMRYYASRFLAHVGGGSNSVATYQKREGKHIDARMLATIRDDSEAVYRSLNAWAEQLTCAKSTVGAGLA
jgi:hypothetical protein